jgi:hypothetical protein
VVDRLVAAARVVGAGRVADLAAFVVGNVAGDPAGSPESSAGRRCEKATATKKSDPTIPHAITATV